MLPGAPDTGQGATGQRQAEHVEQLPGELEHLWRQRRQFVIKAVQHQPIDGLGAGKHHRDQRAQQGQVVVAQCPIAGCGRLRRAADQAGGGEEGTGSQAETEQVAALHGPGLSG
ncbi:hypothetical protein D3C79_985100 [compost metagenome]